MSRSLQPLVFAMLVVMATAAHAADAAHPATPAVVPAPNPSGVAQTYSTLGRIDLENPFFLSLGTNGRACVTCHVPGEGWSIVPASIRLRFAATEGRDPLFRPVDGSVSPYADVSTLAGRRAAYRLLLERGVIRIGIGVPPGAEFDLAAIDDPYGYASVTELSLFRRPLPSTNLAFLSRIMWDGREGDLAGQANGATLGHAQAIRSLTPAEVDAIVRLESALSTAQWRDGGAGALHAAGALGGPQALTGQEFVPGIAADPVFALFASWVGARGRLGEARDTIARGEALFNTRRFTNGPFSATCSSCHSAPNAGSNVAGVFFDLGISDEARRTPDVPLYTLVCRSTGRTTRTTDPGRALITGRCADINRFKVPTLRGLAARAPYFHDGSAATLADVVDFYDRRFAIGLTPAEKAALTAFLAAL